MIEKEGGERNQHCNSKMFSHVSNTSLSFSLFLSLSRPKLSLLSLAPKAARLPPPLSHSPLYFSLCVYLCQ